MEAGRADTSVDSTRVNTPIQIYATHQTYMLQLHVTRTVTVTTRLKGNYEAYLRAPKKR